MQEIGSIVTEAGFIFFTGVCKLLTRTVVYQHDLVQTVWWDKPSLTSREGAGGFHSQDLTVPLRIVKIGCSAAGRKTRSCKITCFVCPQVSISIQIAGGTFVQWYYGDCHSHTKDGSIMFLLFMVMTDAVAHVLEEQQLFPLCSIKQLSKFPQKSDPRDRKWKLLRRRWKRLLLCQWSVCLC